jgi:hypothetical protein
MVASRFFSQYYLALNAGKAGPKLSTAAIDDVHCQSTSWFQQNLSGWRVHQF